MLFFTVNVHLPISDVTVLDINIFTSLSSGRATLSLEQLSSSIEILTSRIIVCQSITKAQMELDLSQEYDNYTL